MAEFYQRTTGDRGVANIEVVFYFGDFMGLAGKVNDVPDVSVSSEQFAAFSGAIDDCQSVVKKESSIEAGDIGVGLDDGCGVDSGESVFLVDNSIGECSGIGVVLVEQEGVPTDSVVLLLDEVGYKVGVV